MLRRFSALIILRSVASRLGISLGILKIGASESMRVPLGILEAAIKPWPLLKIGLIVYSQPGDLLAIVSAKDVILSYKAPIPLVSPGRGRLR